MTSGAPGQGLPGLHRPGKQGLLLVGGAVERPFADLDEG